MDPTTTPTGERIERICDLGADTLAVRHARRFVRRLLVQYGSPTEVVDTVELLASEVVTNAVSHGSGPRRLRCVIADGRVTVSVADGSESPPMLRSPAPLEPHGRGLRLVALLAEKWGVDVRPGHGKEVWFSALVSPA